MDNMEITTDKKISINTVKKPELYSKCDLEKAFIAGIHTLSIYRNGKLRKQYKIFDNFLKTLN